MPAPTSTTLSSSLATTTPSTLPTRPRFSAKRHTEPIPPSPRRSRALKRKSDYIPLHHRNSSTYESFADIFASEGRALEAVDPDAAGPTEQVVPGNKAPLLRPRTSNSVFKVPQTPKSKRRLTTDSENTGFSGPTQYDADGFAIPPPRPSSRCSSSSRRLSGYSPAKPSPAAVTPASVSADSILCRSRSSSRSGSDRSTPLPSPMLWPTGVDDQVIIDDDEEEVNLHAILLQRNRSRSRGEHELTIEALRALRIKQGQQTIANAGWPKANPEAMMDREDEEEEYPSSIQARLAKWSGSWGRKKPRLSLGDDLFA